MSGEVKVVSFFSIALVVLVLANSKKDDVIEPEQVTVLQTEVREVNNPTDIEPISSGLVKPILYTKVTSLRPLPPFEDKTRFVQLILPAILVAKHKIEEDRLRLAALTNALEWSAADSTFLQHLSKAYRTDDITLLDRRLRTHPNSIVLAQAAVESGWGKSRFFKEANNLFGIWSYRANEPRIRASVSRLDYQVYLRSYDNLSESIIDYFQTIGRAKPYTAFRKKRMETSDIDALLPLLSQYSERKEEYVRQLRSMIKFNEFEQYDNYSIDPSYFVSKVVEE
ncbi:glucosaminidase domain-containing protein [Roseivirga sp. E12]|uniref:glucosaminidase domain-containing protein n=1 Tax=Roseivirga sp. E12 TaxID=2819237 RepID=UPI001ABCC740|nr:glucosaminidase domain-containing protein [Roseivirga sp. E12]MBO3697428.1 glucosaminidase domain-containing protein [Roseivirga sp. E12]